MASMMASSLANSDFRRRGVWWRSVIAASDEDIARPANGPYEAGPFRVVAQFLAQAADQNINRAVVCCPINSASLIHDSVASQNTSAIPEEKPKQFELRRSQLEVVSLHPRRARRPTHIQRSDAETFQSISARASTQHGLNAGNQLAGFKRVGQIVVGTHFEPDDSIRYVAARGEHDDRDPAALADLATDGEAVHVGKHHVENQDIRRVTLERPKPSFRMNGGANGNTEWRQVFCQNKVQS